MIKMTQNEVTYIHKKMDKQKPTKKEILDFVQPQRGRFWKRVEEWAKSGMRRKYVVQECFGKSKPTKECVGCNNYEVCADAYDVLKINGELVMVKRQKKSRIGRDRNGRKIIKLMCHDVLKPLIGKRLTSPYDSDQSISVLWKFHKLFPELGVDSLVREWCEKNNQVYDEVWNTVSYKIYYYTRRIISVGLGMIDIKGKVIDDKERIRMTYRKMLNPVLQKQRIRHSNVDGRIMQLLAHDVLKPLIGTKLNHKNDGYKSTTVLRKFHEMFPELKLEESVKKWCEKHKQVFDDVWNTRTSEAVYYFIGRILKGDKNEGE